MAPHGDQTFSDKTGDHPNADPALVAVLQRLVDEHDRSGLLQRDRVHAICERRGIGGEHLDRVLLMLDELGLLPRMTAPVVGFGGRKIAKRGPAVEDLLGRYLHEAGQIPLLTAEDERTLGRRMEAGEAAALRLSQPRGPNKRLEFNEQRSLHRTVREGERAAQQMIRSNLRLVVSEAKKLNGMGFGLPILDLIQEGNLGLFRAVEKFDHTKGFKFSTYATWWIRQSIHRGIANTGRLIRLPVHFHDRMRMILKTRSLLAVELGREPTLAEVSQQADLDPAEVQFALDWSRDTLSLDAPIGDEGMTLADTIGESMDDDPGEMLEGAVRRQLVLEALEMLNERERAVVRLRFGLVDGQDRTLEQVGAEFGVTRERIRQIEYKVLAKLRANKELRELVVTSPRTIGTEVENEKANDDQD